MFPVRAHACAICIIWEITDDYAKEYLFKLNWPYKVLFALFLKALLLLVLSNGSHFSSGGEKFCGP